MSHRSTKFAVATAATLLLAWSGAWSADATAPKDGTIAYALTGLHWAVSSSADGKTECPNGFNDGNREQFKKLFPEDGQKRTLASTQLRREIESWYPTTATDPFEFREATGTTAPGLNLDGNVDADDFTSPEGEKGIDNQMFRALGCIQNYRPAGALDFFEDEMVIRDVYNRVLIELTGVDSLVNASNVGVTIYRGRDPLLIDGTGKQVVPGGTQRIDVRWGARFIQHLRGKIVDGVLMTEPADIVYPFGVFYLPTDQYMYGARLRLKLTPTNAEGLMAGYTDIETWYVHMMKNWSTHHQSYGQTSAPSLYKAFRRLADGQPDPKTGENRAISSAAQVKWTQVVILPSSKQQLASAPQRRATPFRGSPVPRPAAEEAAQGAEKVAATGGRGDE